MQKDDVIYRQAAIDELEAKKDKSAKGDIGCFYNTIIQNNIDALKGLPSAQPERKTGWWICVGIGLMVTEYKCSECGRTVRDDTGYDVCKDYPYCHCGAKMMRKYGKR